MQRILVVMPNWFGEVLFATPFLHALRLAVPNGFIATLGVPRCEEVLAQNPHLNEMVLYDETGRDRTWAAKRRVISALRAKRFDTAFILRRSVTRTMMLAFAGIPRRIGFANLKSGWLLTHRVPPPPVFTHKARGYLRLLEPLSGLPASDARYQYYPSEQERAQAEALLREHGLAAGQPFIVLHPGANWVHKRWPAERFAQLAQRLAQASAPAVVLTGAPDDVSLADAICRRLTSRPAVLVGRTTLRQLAACLERAALVVSNDTGVLHIACALRRPVVALYGPTSPTITGPLGDPARTKVIHHPDCCPAIPCFQPDHPKHPGMESITVEEVYDAARHMLIVQSSKPAVRSEKTNP